MKQTRAASLIESVVVDAPAIVDRARAFVGHNKRRIAIGNLDIHRALVAAGDEDALDVQRVCERAGVTLRMGAGRLGITRPGDCAAIATIRKLIRKHGVIRARRALEALVKAKMAPIQEAHVLAADFLLSENVSFEDLCAAARVEGDMVLAKAKLNAKLQKKFIWQSVADLWLKRIKGKK